ncbi:MAG: hypothetical protein Q4D89_07445 [Arachnia propionica]|uniref:hypothetical protein n=1 Tax=Arachnia propionica TaxID=1750 RepID=UPI0026FEDFB5|nr:hypothetical protein [Arachnia propionica]
MTPFMEFVPGGGGVHLNFVEARALAPVIDIVVTGSIRPHLIARGTEPVGSAETRQAPPTPGRAPRFLSNWHPDGEAS